MRQMLWILLALTVCGCEAVPIGRTASDEVMFGPQTMRLQPTFTQIKDWNGDKIPDGIDAIVELQDQFGDTTRATGRVIFELYGYRYAAPDPRGERIGGPWIGSLQTKEDQVAHWSSAIRGYSFQLAQLLLSRDRTYVLTAEFDLGTRRLFDQVVIQGKDFASKRHGQINVHAPPQAPTH
jgi:hypothetical protein